MVQYKNVGIERGQTKDGQPEHRHVELGKKEHSRSKYDISEDVLQEHNLLEYDEIELFDQKRSKSYSNPDYQET
jgi:hypothetical protein